MDIKKRQAIEVLATGQSLRDSAKTIGCSPTSLLAWKKDSEFANELKRLEDLTIEQLRAEREHYNRLVFSSAIESVKTLLELLQSEHEITRLTAARQLLDRFDKLPQIEGDRLRSASEKLDRESAYQEICREVYGL